MAVLLRILMVAAVVLWAAPAGWAQQADTEDNGVAANVPAGADTEEHPQERAEPRLVDRELDTAYLGRITGNNVYVRSGPGAVYYDVMQLFEDDQVIVVRERHGRSNWAQIEAPPGSFSFIAREFVALDRGDAAAEPDMNMLTAPIPGRVTGNNVRIRAGSPVVPPARADQVQLRVSRGDDVMVIGQRDDFYEIVPPEGAYFWVSLDFVERIGAVSDEARTALAEAKLAAVGASEDEAGAAVREDRQEYRDILALVETEQAKPVAEQNYADIRARLATLANDTPFSGVRTDANYLLRRVDRLAMAADVYHRAREQERRLQEALARIDAEMRQALEAGQRDSEQAAPVLKVRLRPAVAVPAIEGRPVFQVRDQHENIIFHAVAMHDRLDLSQYVDGLVSLTGVFRTSAATGGLRVLYVTSVSRQVEAARRRRQQEEAPDADAENQS